MGSGLHIAYIHLCLQAFLGQLIQILRQPLDGNRDLIPVKLIAIVAGCTYLADCIGSQHNILCFKRLYLDGNRNLTFLSCKRYSVRQILFQINIDLAV